MSTSYERYLQLRARARKHYTFTTTTNIADRVDPAKFSKAFPLVDFIRLPSPAVGHGELTWHFKTAQDLERFMLWKAVA